MNAVLACLAVMLPGIDVGWQPRPEGGMEYIIQIEPGMLAALEAGEQIESIVDPQVRDLRKFRVVIGKGKLPQQLPPKSMAPPSGPALTMPPATLPANPASKPLTGQSAVYVESAGDRPVADASKPAPQPGPAEKPWMLFWAVILGLGASVTANAYLGWIFWETHTRCRSALGRPAAAANEAVA